MSNHFQEVALAGLLHDIGKFYSRSSKVQASKRDLKKDSLTLKHPYYSKLFIKKVIGNALKSISLDVNLLEDLVLKHHEDNRSFEELYQPSSIKNTEQRLLALLISRADSYSSRERRETKAGFPSYKQALMQSPFYRIKLNEEQERKPQGAILPSNLLSFKNLADFLDKVSPQEDKEVLQDKFDKLIREFALKAQKIQADNFSQLFNSLSSLIYQYCWCIPADSREEIRDVSLYDHLKTTSTLATCLYLYHQENETFTESDIKKETENKFLLIGGDLSGIQKYLFDIAKISSGAVAKRLRARSFRLSLLSEAAAVYILKELKLPTSCLLFSSGGRFEILAPNTGQTIDALNVIKRTLDKWFLENYLGELSLNIAWQEFSPENLKAGAEKTKDYAFICQQLANKLETAKTKKFNSILAETNHILPFKNNSKICKSCGKLPSTEEDEDVCKICKEDKDLGEKLATVKYISFFPAKEFLANFSFNIPSELSFSFCGEKIILASSYQPKITNQSYLTYLLFPQAAVVENEPQPVVIKPLANWQPKENNRLLTFEDLALGEKATSFEDKNLNQENELSFLGVLKADVDNLGYIFSTSLGQDLTMSRKSNLSTAMDIFFGAVVHLFAKEKNLYTVFSGGDDLFLIGKWDKTIQAAFELHENFQKFTGKHPDVTISAGIILVKPKTPIWYFANQANAELEKSKDAGRNRLSCLGGILPWNSQEKEVLRDLQEAFTQALREEIISTNFIYNLLNLQRQYLWSEKPFYYKPKLAYQIARNIIPDEINNEGKKDSIANFRNLIIKHLIECQQSDLHMANISFAVSYALLKQRTEKGGNNEL